MKFKKGMKITAFGGNRWQHFTADCAGAKNIAAVINNLISLQHPSFSSAADM
jgi:hypothetical protein